MKHWEKRAATLLKVKTTSNILRSSSDEEVAFYKLVFKRKGSNTTGYPFWNMLNGSLADAAWHVGQGVSFNSNMSLFNGRPRN